MLLQTYWQMIRSFGRDARLLLLGVAVVGFALDGTIAVLLNLYLLRLGYGPEFVGVVNSGGLLAFALCSLPAGMVGSRWGSRRAMMTGYGIGVVGGVALSLAELLPAAVQPAVLVGSYMVIMLGMSLVFVNMGPYLMAITTPQQRSHAFAVQSALLSLAAFGGSLLAGFLPGWLAAGL
ncbi:MAG: MFS transporter, partial [Anaerolineales bacterium]|nr:MFS transporter [Anaerolineales bacterium]